MTKEFFNLKELTASKGMSIHFWRKRIYDGSIRSYKFGLKNMVRVADAEKWIEKQRQDIPNVRSFAA